MKNILISYHWKWPAQGTGTVPTVSAHFRSLQSSHRIHDCGSLCQSFVDLNIVVGELTSCRRVGRSTRCPWNNVCTSRQAGAKVRVRTVQWQSWVTYWFGAGTPADARDDCSNTTTTSRTITDDVPLTIGGRLPPSQPPRVAILPNKTSTKLSIPVV